jgi:23S rRNA pseudouridine1911/1915/1917 synthase
VPSVLLRVLDMRLDKYLKSKHPDLSWSQIRGAIEKGQVTVDGRDHRDPGLDVYDDAVVDLNINRPAQSRARAAFDILHEDDEIIVLNKPAGLLSIPSSPEAGSSEDTVLRRVREYMEFKLGHKSYVGMLHRLDRDTSGSLAVALSKDAHAAGRELFKAHRFERHYLALVQGIPNPPQGTIHARISSGYRDGRRKLVDADKSGLDATTDYKVRERLNNAALLELRLHTGRQHQIRLHLEKLGHPLIGERVYSGDQDDPRPRTQDPRLKTPASAKASARQASVTAKRNMLHAWTLAFPHPITGKKIAVEAPLPGDFIKVMKRLALN